MTIKGGFKPRIIIDWLQFTLLRDHGLDTVIKIVGQPLADYKLLDKGGLGYRRQMLNNNIRIYYDGLAGMGVCASISGQGCRYLESKGIDLWRLLFTLGRSGKINITRLDIALDTDTPLLLRVKQALDKGLYISKSRSFKYITSIVDGMPQVETIYIGSRQSEVFIRIYDKAKERGLTDTVWERWEIVFKKDKIKQVINLLRKDISSTFKGILFNYFRPITRVEKNKSRSPVTRWYKNFIGDVEKIGLYRAPEQKTIEDKYSWLERQVAPTMSLLSMAFEDTKFLEALAESSAHRVKEKDLLLVNKFKEQGVLE